METLAVHFRLHSDALYFPMITFVLTYSPERKLCVIIHSAGRGGRDRKHCFQLKQDTANLPHSCLLLRAVGSHSIPMVGPSFFSLTTGSACAEKDEEWHG